MTIEISTDMTIEISKEYKASLVPFPREILCCVAARRSGKHTAYCGKTISYAGQRSDKYGKQPAPPGLCILCP